ncbi:MAG TPA: B12-binding domain-containing radical SAM protein [Candidatus Tripitaka californicus]|uniref:B12-binding domain-containing radical SAM protein n=1 Tax=Candidatus Tripitaka californicus TaxID=3367616 RepID=UPI0040292581
MKKMLLINPHPPGRHGEESIHVIVQMPLNLAYIAALTPGDWEFDVVDENKELALDEKEQEITFEPPDLVAITALTYQAPRAYRIAMACRKRGIPVIMGGIHASVCSEEAVQYVDAVITGEAETVWPEVIRDFEQGQLKKIYNGGLPPLSVLKKVYPNRELLKKKYGYKFSSIITTKGCPNRCDFCSVPTFQGQKFRERPYEDVLDEMAATDYKGLMFAEDNFYGHSVKSAERAKNLFRGMIDRNLGKNWLGFTALNIGLDPEVLQLMTKSGCFGFLVGIESTNEQVLKKMNKRVNLKLGTTSYKDCIKKVHDAGLIVWGSVVFGADGDDKDSFKRMVDFILDCQVDILTYGLDCPFPKTPLFYRLDAERRLFRKNFPWDWQYYETAHVVHRLVDMTLDDFVNGMQYVYDHLYAGDNLRMRFKNSIKATGNPRNSMFALRVSQDWDQVFKQVLENLHKLQESGDYYKDCYKETGKTAVSLSGTA